MEYLGYDEDGNNADNWGSANEDNFNNDKAMFSVVVSGETHVHKYGMYPDGNTTNPIVVEKFDEATGIVKDPDRYGLGVLGDDRTNAGFKQLPKGWFGERKVLEKDPEEGDFLVSDVFYYSGLAATSVQGIVPVFEPSCGIVEKRKVNGLCRGQQQRRIGGFMIGINLGLLSLFLSEMSLKGGYMFYVERKSGFVIGTSNKDMPLNDADNKPVHATAATDPKIVDRARWLLDEREGRSITWADVQSGTAEAEINGEANFMYIVEYTDFGVDWIGVLSIPWDSVMEDIQRAKWGTLAWGMVLALGIKFLLQILAAFISAYFWNTTVYPALDKSAVKDLQALQEGSAAGTKAKAGAAAVGVGAAMGGAAAAAAFVVGQ